MKNVLLVILLFTSVNIFAQSGPPDDPITPQEWLENMNYGSWWLFTPPNESDNWIMTDNYSSKMLDSLQALGINGGRLHWQAANDFDETLHIPQYIIDFYDGIIDDMMERKMSVCLQVHFADKEMTEEVKQRTFNGWRQVCEAFKNKSHYLAMCPMIEFHGWDDYYVVDGDTVWSTDAEYDENVKSDSLNWLYDSLTVIFRESNPDRIISFKPWGSARKAEFETLALPFGNDPGFDSDDPKYYMVSFSGSYGMGEWWRWEPNMDAGELKMIKEQTMRAGLSETKDAGIHHAINWREQTGIQFWCDHWDPAYWKRYGQGDEEQWSIEQNLAYIKFFTDTLKAIGSAGAGMQTCKYWNDKKDDLIRLGDSFFKDVAEFDTMSVEMMKLLKSMADDTSTAVLKIHDSPRIKVYPNPATSFLNIEKPGDVSAVVYSLEGVSVAAINDGVQEIDFPAGLCLIVFMDKSGRVETTKKLIIQ